MAQGRITYAKKNIAFGYMGTLLTALLGFAARKLFILRLDGALLGVNDLYTGILSVLSLAELGIGTALNFSLYKPIAEGDREKIKSCMALYKKSYRVIAFVVGTIGVLLIPFLKYIIKDPGKIGARDLTLYYCIFLFNSVTSYLVAYKYSLVNAEQRGYIQTNITTVTKLISVSAQIAVLFATSNFYVYLLTDAVIQLVQKIFVSWYLNRIYPFLLEEAMPLAKEETSVIVEKTKALMWLKIGDIARLQTDSIIISAFISITITGVVGNFNMVISTVANFVNVIFNSVLSSFGNAIATESRKRQELLFRVYRFFAEWLYGLLTVGFFVLLTPLIILLYGEKMALPQTVIVWIVAEFYFKGDRIVLSNFKTAAGVFEQDKFLALVQGAVNLVISIVLAKRIGLAGVYIGTVVSGLLANFIRPPIIYHVCFGKSSGSYFLDSCKYRAVMGAALFSCHLLSKWTLPEISIPAFLLTAGMITVVFHGFFLGAFYRSEEMNYLKQAIFRRKQS